MKKYKLLITDLDGTLIEALSGDTFPKGIWDMKIKLYVFEAIKNYAPDDILIISNQGGIEKGFVDKEMFEYKFDYISSALEDYTNISVYNFYCDNNDKDNINRKPNTGMIDQYMDYIKFINDNVDEENKIIYDTIMMIGDAPEKKGSSPTPIRRRRKTSGVSIWMWMILCINIITDNENKKDRMIIAYPSLIM